MRIGAGQLWVHDQDEALAFWTEKVGMEVRSDVTLPENSTAQRVGTSEERSPSRWGESLRPTARERDLGLPHREAV